MSVQPIKAIQQVNFNLLKNKDETNGQPRSRHFNASSTHQTLLEKAATSLKSEPLSREELRQYMSDFYQDSLRQHLRSVVWEQLAPIIESVNLGDKIVLARRGEVADVHPSDVHPNAGDGLPRLISQDAEELRQNSCAIRSALSERLASLRAEGCSDCDQRVDALLGMQHILGNALAGSLLTVELVLLVPQDEMGQKLDLLNKGFGELVKISDRLDGLEQEPDKVRFFLLSEIQDEFRRRGQNGGA